MSPLLIVLVVLAAAALGAGLGWLAPPNGRRPRRELRPGSSRILLPFTGSTISRRSLEAAVRIARAEGATIMPAYLARVPRHLPLDAPLPRQCARGMPLLEAIEQKAARADVAVDSRIGRGRSYRDALNRLLEAEPIERVVVSATGDPNNGLSTRDLEWLLQRVDSEVLILRPAAEDDRRISGALVAGHF